MSPGAVLVVNAGSSSLKLRVVGDGDRVDASHDVDGWDGGADSSVFEALGPALAGVEAVGHRVVHGGPDLLGPTVLDDGVVARIEALAPLAPLHQPRAVAAIRAAAKAMPGLRAVACFDTDFHSTIPDAAATYALPEEWRARWPLRRFGFHGLSHAWAAARAADLAGRSPEGLRVVTAHLGAGASLCAIRDGRSVDTTMGFTPLEGLVMNTRSGSVDPGLVLWLVTGAGLAPEEVAAGLESGSGLAGLSGTDGDLRTVLAAAGDGDRRAALALAVYAHRARREVAGMAAALGGIDVLVFTGGAGEHLPPVRAAVAAGLGFLGVALDPESNASTTADGDIGAAGARVRTFVVTAREDLEIARRVRAVLG